MDLSNIAAVTDPAALAAHAAALDEAAEELHLALTRFTNAFLDYADRIFTDEAEAEEARADLFTLRADLTAAHAAVDRLSAATPADFLPSLATLATLTPATEIPNGAAASASALVSPAIAPATAPATALAARPHGGYANAETQSVIRCLDSNARAVEIARAIVATAWINAADAIAADRAAIVAPRQDAADDLHDWLDEENPLAESASLFTDLLTHALERVEWREVADHYAPDPLPSIEPIESEEEAEEEEEEPSITFTPISPICPHCGVDLSQLGQHHAAACPLAEEQPEEEEEEEEQEQEPQQTDPSDIEPGYLSADDQERARRSSRPGRMRRRH